MASPPSHKLRRSVDADKRPAFAVFRRALYEYLHRTGYLPSPEVTDAEIDEAWSARAEWIHHLWATAAQNWVAVTPATDAGPERVVGWAMSIEREGALELTHFFVEPGVQARGLGRALLAAALPEGRGRHRSILATQDPAATALYLRSGVRHLATAVDFARAPEAVTIETDLVFERLAPDDDAVRAVGDVEGILLGHRRDVDTRFLLGIRSAWAARRAGRVVGFAFGAQDGYSGPMGALDPADVPALLALVEREAATTGETEFSCCVPLANDTAVRYLLDRGFRIEPFWVNVLSDDATLRLDRWVITGPQYRL